VAKKPGEGNCIHRDYSKKGKLEEDPAVSASEVEVSPRQTTRGSSNLKRNGRKKSQPAMEGNRANAGGWD